MHPKVLKESAHIISEFLSVLFIKSLKSGRLPRDWKSAIVIPLHKKGSTKKTEDFRPVSLTSIICKILESIIRDSIVEHMDKNKLFIEHQHGFRSKRSCVTQLLEVIDDWYEILDDKGCIDVIYLDFQKAFDTVPHRRLLNKMYAYGIRGQLLKWTESFLIGRTQKVRVSNAVSSERNVLSGIPQGSVLGPILFLVFINDLPDVVECSVKLFADDTKIYSAIENHDDCAKIQKDIDNLAAWSDKWLLRFNALKCKCLHEVHVGKNNIKHDYHMKVGDKDILIAEVNEEKDIGVTFDNRMKFDVHIRNIVNKANQRIGIIRRTFDHLDKNMFLMLYKTLVRPILEYATVIWSPWLKKDIVAIEQCQRRATRLVKDLKDKSYGERLKELGIPTLVYRRERTDVLQIFKIMEKFDEVHMKSIKPSHNISTRGHDKKLEKRHHNLKSTKNVFPTRVLSQWNDLPNDCVESKTVNRFKNSLNIAWKQKPNKFEYKF